MIDDGKTGLIVPPRNIEALAHAIESYLDNPLLLQKMSENISKSVSSGKGSWDIVAKEYIKVYNHE